MTIQIDPKYGVPEHSTVTCPTEIERDVVEALGSFNPEVTSRNHGASRIETNIPAALAINVLCDSFRADYEENGAGYRINAQVLGIVRGVHAPYHTYQEGERVERIFGFPDGQPRSGVVVSAHNDGVSYDVRIDLHSQIIQDQPEWAYIHRCRFENGVMNSLGGEFAGVPVLGDVVRRTDEVNGTYFVGVVTDVLRQQKPVGENAFVSKFTCEINVTEGTMPVYEGQLIENHNYQHIILYRLHV